MFTEHKGRQMVEWMGGKEELEHPTDSLGTSLIDVYVCYEFDSAHTRDQVELVAPHYQKPPCLIDGATN